MSPADSHQRRALLGACLLGLSGLALHAQGDEDGGNAANEKRDSEHLMTRVLEAGVDNGPSFGWHIGDRLEQHIRWPADEPAPDLQPLSPVRRVSTWLERQQVQWLDESTGGGRTLSIRYQIINVPQQVQTAFLPELSFASRMHDSTQLQVPAWSFSLGPLTPDPAETVAHEDNADAARSSAPLGLLQPDRAPAAADTQRWQEARNRYLAGLCLTLIAWALWFVWRERWDRKRLPFSAAYRQLRQRAQVSGKADGQPSEWQILHQAFNRQAGRTLGRQDVPVLLDDAPWLVSMRSAIDDFFIASEARHFELPAKEVRIDLLTLSQRLARLERRHRH